MSITRRNFSGWCRSDGASRWDRASRDGTSGADQRRLARGVDRTQFGADTRIHRGVIVCRRKHQPRRAASRDARSRFITRTPRAIRPRQ